MASIFITGTIKPELMKEVQEALDTDTRSIDVFINTYGGCAATSFAVHDLLKQDERVRIFVQGAAYSGGAVIALAKNDFQMTPNSQFMVHKTWRNVGGVNTNELKEIIPTFEHWDKPMRKLFKDILTKEELAKFDAGKDVYVSAKELSKR